MRIPGLMVNFRKAGLLFLTSISLVFVFGAFVNPPFLRPLLGVTCHRLPHRSFLWAPGLCARCSFFWIGVLLSSMLMLFRRLPASIIVGLIFVLPMFLDGSMQLIGLYESTNVIRMFTGLAAGVGFCMMLEGGAKEN